MNWKQAPSSIFMVRPATFTFNSQTAGSNAFQQPVSNSVDVGKSATLEFDLMVEVLRSNQIDVIVFQDSPSPTKPDALFPNNWISIHESGQLVLYPMMAPNRRLERRLDIIDSLKSTFEINEVLDFSKYEEQEIFMEGTGSLIFDHVNRLAYACRSARTNEMLLTEICNKLGYKAIVFDAVDVSGKPIYHTNVMMCVGNKFSVVCIDSIKSEEDQELVLGKFAETGHQVISISYDQMKSFAGNMLEIKNILNESVILMSQTAFDSLLPGQLNAISKHGDILPIAIPTIEAYGGGSIRCMVGGIHAPRRVIRVCL